MKNENFKKLVALIQKGLEIRAGCTTPRRLYEIKPTEIQSVREKHNVSQNEFAFMFGVIVRTLRNWEQGGGNPEGSAKALLFVASRNPEPALMLCMWNKEGQQLN